MPDIDYLKIFRDAWKITWKNRSLWWFGFFMLLTGFSSNYSVRDNKNPSQEWQKLTDQFHLQEFIAAHTTLLIIAGALFFVVFLISIVLSLIGRGALMKSTQRLLKNESVNFHSGWKDGKRYFWNNFKIVFFSGLALIFCILILVIPTVILFLAKNYLIAIPLAILAVLIIITLIVIYKYIQTYACLYTTLADLRPWVATENAYALFKKNISASIIMSLFFIPLGIFSFFAVLLIFLAILIVFGLLGVALYFALHQVGIIIALIPAVIFFILALVLFYSIFMTFSQVAWVLFFYKIATPKTKEIAVENSQEVEVEKNTSNPAVTDGIKTSE